MQKSRNDPTRSLEDGLLLKIIYKALQCQSHRELVIELLAVFKDTSSIDFLVKLLHTLQPSQECTEEFNDIIKACLLYTSDAADDMQCVDLGGRRIIKK